VLGLALLAGCLRLPPDLAYQVLVTPEELQAPAYYLDPQDSSAVFEQEGFRLKVRLLSDAQLNQEYARYTFREPNLNPFTYGRDRDLDLGYTPPRFTVLQVTVFNQGFPKVQLDPARISLRTDRGEVLEYWDVLKRDARNSFEAYYMDRRGQGGNEEYYYSQRLGVVREALFRRHTWVYKGDTYTGKVVFAPLHPQVREVVVRVQDIVLRVDAFDRPKETVEAEFRFAVEQKVVY
jgi:hypothetical protein